MVKTQLKVAAFSLFLAGCFWVADTLVYLRVSGRGTFTRLLFTDIPPDRLIIRMVVLSCFLVFAIVISRAVALRHQAQERISHLNAVLRAIRNVNHLVTRERNRDRLLQAVCDSLIETRGYQSSWIVLLDSQGQFADAFASGLDDRFAALREVLAGDTLVHCMHRVLDEPGPVVVEKPEAACGDCPLAGTYQDTASLITQLEHNGQVYGVLSVSLPVAVATDDEEQLLFSDVAADIAFALYSIDVRSQRERIQQALRESETEYRTLTENLPDVVLRVSPEGIMSYVSSAITRLAGYQPEEGLGKSVIDFVAEDDRPRVKQALERVGQTGATYRLEFMLITKDGQKIPVEINSFPLMEEGEIVSLQCVMRDISQRKQAEEALRQAYERNETILRTSMDGFLTVRPEGIIADCNEAFCNIVGYSREELLGMNATKLDAIQTPEQVTERMQQVMETGSGRFETALWRQDESRVAVEISITFVELPEDKFFVAFVRDITTRKRVQQALIGRTEELDERIKKLDCLYGISRLVETPDISLEQILQGIVELLPPAWQYPEITCGRLVVEDQVYETSNYREPIAKLAADVRVQDERVGRVEVGYLEQIPELDIEPFPPEERELLDTVAEQVGRIVERMRAEAELARHRNHLEQLVEERTVELEAVNKELESFAYSVSHDLRAPLRAMDGFSEALLQEYEDALDATGQDYLRRVRAASQHMDQLIDDLLQLSRITRGDIQQEQVNLSALATAVAAELQEAEPQRQVEFLITDGLVADGDPRLLRVVMENLLSNAWKFTSQQPCGIIEVGKAEQDGQQVYFVRDNGTGFDMAYADKLFSAFQRLHSDAEFEGNGIGLATVQRIIHRHGGRIWGEGEVGQGATFYFAV